LDRHGRAFVPAIHVFDLPVAFLKTPMPNPPPGMRDHK
jgi:hypothetical protein